MLSLDDIPDLRSHYVKSGFSTFMQKVVKYFSDRNINKLVFVIDGLDQFVMMYMKS